MNKSAVATPLGLLALLMGARVHEQTSAPAQAATHAAPSSVEAPESSPGLPDALPEPTAGAASQGRAAKEDLRITEARAMFGVTADDNELEVRG